MSQLDKATAIRNGIDLDGVLGIFQGTIDPSVSGWDAPLGSMFLRTTGLIYQKTTAPTTGWVVIGASDVFTGDSGSGGIQGLVPAPAAGDAAAMKVLHADGTWAIIPGASANHAVYAYDTTVQGITTANAWQDLTFSNNSLLTGWTHTPGSALFGCTKTDTYLCTLDMSYERNSGGSPEFAARVLFNGVLVPGTQLGVDVQANNTAFKMARTFTVDAVAGQDLRVQIASSIGASSMSVQPGPDPVGGGSPSSASLTIRR